MPFTPFHMGPGILVKATLRGSFSLMVFGFAQILMDIQPLIVLLTGKGHLHGFSHTYVGASIIAVLAALSGKYLSEFGLIILGIAKKSNPIKISWMVSFISAFIGAFSHVILDSMMHTDVEPFSPFNSSNNLLGIISIAELHKFCLYSGLIGAGIYFGTSKYKSRGN
jgi:membrane-bound metal-dependent hydrolase YbcI (DUF457 family)